MDLTGDRSQKITPRHLRRQAYLYVRQSTLRQVVENTESTQRQYALRHRAVALGWSIEQVVVIDRDLGHSGASAADREGFQQLVRDVGLGRAGLVMGLEVSRLARNSMDWHRLLEICALTETLILDEDGLYDPAHFNDRLLLGLKGTMSEAELHVLRARLRGGIVNKARRGELEVLSFANTRSASSWGKAAILGRCPFLALSVQQGAANGSKGRHNTKAEDRSSLAATMPDPATFSTSPQRETSDVCSAGYPEGCWFESTLRSPLEPKGFPVASHRAASPTPLSR